MQIDVATLTPEAHKAIVECLKIAARRGRQLREARERDQDAACTGSLLGNVANEEDKQFSPEDQSQQAKHSPQERSKPHSGRHMD